MTKGNAINIFTVSEKALAKLNTTMLGSLCFATQLLRCFYALSEVFWCLWCYSPLTWHFIVNRHIQNRKFHPCSGSAQFLSRSYDQFKMSLYSIKPELHLLIPSRKRSSTQGSPRKLVVVHSVSMVSFFDCKTMELDNVALWTNLVGGKPSRCMCKLWRLISQAVLAADPNWSKGLTLT